MCSGVCIFSYHASGYIYVFHQVELNTVETIRGKTTFERGAKKYGVVVNTYNIENVVLIYDNFMQELLKP